MRKVAKTEWKVGDVKSQRKRVIWEEVMMGPKGLPRSWLIRVSMVRACFPGKPTRGEKKREVITVSGSLTSEDGSFHTRKTRLSV